MKPIKQKVDSCQVKTFSAEPKRNSLPIRFVDSLPIRFIFASHSLRFPIRFALSLHSLQLPIRFISLFASLPPFNSVILHHSFALLSTIHLKKDGKQSKWTRRERSKANGRSEWGSEANGGSEVNGEAMGKRSEWESKAKQMHGR